MLLRLKRRDPSRALSSSLSVPCPAGLSYDPYQIAAIDYAVKRRDTLIGDEPGLGKTIEAIGIANFLGCEQILVICPSYLKPNWQAEFIKWRVSQALDVVYVKSGKPCDFASVTIISYELLDKHGEFIRQVDWDLLIVDEAHRLKNGRADRTLQVFGGIKRNSEKQIIARYTEIGATRRVFMTGTPVLNGKPKELWPLLRSVDPEGLGSDWFAFAKRYCDLIEITRFNPAKGKDERVGWKWDGATHLDELQNRMREKFMIRRLKRDVMKQLPPKRRVILPLEANRDVRKLLDAELQSFEEWAGKDVSDDTYLEMPAFSDFAHRMQEIGLLMIKPTIEVVENDLETINKIVVMCYHNEVSRQIADHFPGSLLVNGFVDVNERTARVEQFQTSDIKLLVGTIGSAGEGLTMTKASLMIFPERDWTPGKVTQAEDRIHRRGQLSNVIIKHLVLQGSLSERQTRILVAKQNRNDNLLDVDSNA